MFAIDIVSLLLEERQTEQWTSVDSSTLLRLIPSHAVKSQDGIDTSGSLSRQPQFHRAVQPFGKIDRVADAHLGRVDLIRPYLKTS